MDFRILIDPSPAAQQQAAAAGGTPAQLAGLTQGGGSGSLDLSQRLPSPDWQLNLWQDTDKFLTPTREALRDYSSMQGQRDWAAEYRKMWEEIFTAADQAKQGLEDETAARARGVEVLKERYRLESAAVEAARTYEQEMLLRQRSLEVQQERHRIEGAAAEEARLQLAGEKEAKQWRQQVEQERRKQDPGAAMSSDLGNIGQMLSGASGGKGPAAFAGRAFNLAGQAGGIPESLEAISAAGSAGGMAGALGALGAAAGPAGLALAGVQLGADAAKSAFDFAGQQVEHFGRQMSALVRNDYAALAENQAENAAKAAEMMPILGDALGSAIRTATSTFMIWERISGEFLAAGQAMANYSASVAGAQAMTDVRKQMGDVREADALGPALARLESSQSKTNDAMRELTLPFKEIVLEVVALRQELTGELFQAVASLVRDLGAMRAFADGVKDVVQGIREKLGVQPADDLKVAGEFVNNFGRVVDPSQVVREARVNNMNPPIMRRP